MNSVKLKNKNEFNWFGFPYKHIPRLFQTLGSKTIGSYSSPGL
jgi:hypothetical protein